MRVPSPTSRSGIRDLSFHFARDQTDLQKMTYNARTGERTAQNRSQRSTTTSYPNVRATRHRHPRSDSPRTPIPACMASISEFVEEAKGSGLVERAVPRKRTSDLGP